eukprot:scaffold273_cov86-Amphora_coffeaeformis.AAC.1
MVKSPQERATGLVPRAMERVSEEYLGMVAMAKRREVGRAGGEKGDGGGKGQGSCRNWVATQPKLIKIKNGRAGAVFWEWRGKWLNGWGETKVAEAAMSTAISTTSTVDSVANGGCRGWPEARRGGQGEWARGWAGARVAVGGTVTVPTTATGEAIEVPEKWAVATLKGRTNVVDKGGSSGQGGKGLGGQWAWGRVSTASTVSTSTRKGSSTGAGWVKGMEKG